MSLLIIIGLYGLIWCILVSTSDKRIFVKRRNVNVIDSRKLLSVMKR